MNKLICLIIAAIAIGTIYATQQSIPKMIMSKFMSAPTKDMFKTYHMVYKKTYDLNSEEGIRRYKTFKSNMKFIQQENSKGHTYTLGVGPYTDLTNAEYRQKVLMTSEQSKKFKKSFNGGEKLNFLSDNEETQAATIDWKSQFGAVFDQGQCGSCWAFATTGAVEGNYHKTTGQAKRFSAQQLVSCSKQNDGCDGGDMGLAFDYIKASGLNLEADYPYSSSTYNGSTGSCNASTVTSKAKKVLNSYTTCGNENRGVECTYAGFKALIAQGPVTVGIDAGSDEFQNYESGVITLDQCSESNHAVIAVGFSTGTTGDVITIRNSWSADWGEAGYIRVSASSGSENCYITQYAWLPIVKAFTS